MATVKPGWMMPEALVCDIHRVKMKLVVHRYVFMREDVSAELICVRRGCGRFSPTRWPFIEPTATESDFKALGFEVVIEALGYEVV